MRADSPSRTPEEFCLSLAHQEEDCSTVSTSIIMKENKCGLRSQTVFIIPALILTRYVTGGKVSPERLDYIYIFINVLVCVML